MSRVLFCLLPILMATCKLKAQEQDRIFCGKEHYYSVDIRAKQIADSLRLRGIDTILVYRHQTIYDSYAGYGKVLWCDKGLVSQCELNVGPKWMFKETVKNVSYSRIDRDTVFSFIFKEWQYLLYNPGIEQHLFFSHEHEHFVWLLVGNRAYCFTVENSLVYDTRPTPRAALAKKLAIEPSLIRHYRYVNYNYGIPKEAQLKEQ